MNRRLAGDVETGVSDSGSVEASGGLETPGGGEASDTALSRPREVVDPYDDAVDSDNPMPNADRLVGECVTLAGTRAADDPQLLLLVAHYWRLVPDEELVGRTPE